ncbi:MAG: hypothetical protein U9R60_09710, partial [Bacteroidota bacterium]|nr:hypothetical protein [Bacteroidota bacterium]
MKIRFQILTYLFLLFPFIAFTQSGSTDLAGSDSSTIIKPEVILLININDEIENSRQMIDEKSLDLELSEVVKKIDSLLKEKEIFLDREAREFREYNTYNLSKFFLENTYRAWEGYHGLLRDWKYEVNTKLSRAQKNISDLDFIKTEWEITLESSMEAGEPVELQERITDVIVDLDSLTMAFHAKVGTLIILEALITDKISFTNGIIEDVGQLQQYLRDSLFVARAVPLWKISVTEDDIGLFSGRVSKFWHENAKIFRNYFQSLNLILYLIIVAVFTLLFYRLKRRYRKIELTEADPGFVNVNRIMVSNFYPSLFSMIIFLFILMFPYNPLAFSDILALLLLFFMQYVLRDFTGLNGKKVIWVLLILLFINQFEILMWYFGDVARLYILFEASLVIVLTAFIISPVIRRKLSSESPFMRRTVQGAFILFVLSTIAFIANIFGYLDLSVLLLKVGVKSSMIIVIVYGLTKIIKAIVISIAAIGRSLKRSFLFEHIDKFESRTLGLINILAVIYSFSIILSVFEVYRPVIDWCIKTLEHEWVIKSLTISIGG